MFRLGTPLAELLGSIGGRSIGRCSCGEDLDLPRQPEQQYLEAAASQQSTRQPATFQMPT
jgi:hypothetical protein